jgi:hypothetical protein
VASNSASGEAEHHTQVVEGHPKGIKASLGFNSGTQRFHVTPRGCQSAAPGGLVRISHQALNLIRQGHDVGAHACEHQIMFHGSRIPTRVAGSPAEYATADNRAVVVFWIGERLELF